MICTKQSSTQQKFLEAKNTQNPDQKPKLYARWTTLDGKLVRKWFTSSK
ncbi:MAG: hypothetical protein QNJ55_10600 [Xenococcus sp. MO_188.B8]|nr:hypothetical protein [Xenococcus sp. MO_188.B8]